MVRILTCILMLFLSGCATPRIIGNDSSATVTVNTTTLGEKSIHPDEAIYVSAFTSDQTSGFDRAKNISILKPDKTHDTFFLDGNTSYRLDIAFNSFGFLNQVFCLASLQVTPEPKASYHIQFNVNENLNSCSLIFKDKNQVLVNETFSKKVTYFVPIIIPL
ncbi:hypothetical protein [Shewanella nanhaiensis]|uniref:Lipoprotein n=1 Tax=Shewanella nanhaiensis TaxID=2864872 RepID=A0ABS7E1S3_9GAMM|nr:hypothetical protein [Shewanella nanhaiensis]MBW8183599.1 hypothetical protein [Shewanella nanhaiensis]